MIYKNCYFALTPEPETLENICTHASYVYFLANVSKMVRRCAAIRLSCQPEPSAYVLHGKVDGLNSEGQHDQRSVPLGHTHKPQKGPYPGV